LSDKNGIKPLVTAKIAAPTPLSPPPKMAICWYEIYGFSLSKF